MDAERVCLVLDVTPIEFADVARREAARRMRLAAEQLDDPMARIETALFEADRAGRWLTLAEVFEEAWERQHPETREGSDVVTKRGDQASPRSDAAAARSKTTDPEDWSA